MKIILFLIRAQFLYKNWKYLFLIIFFVIHVINISVFIFYWSYWLTWWITNWIIQWFPLLTSWYTRLWLFKNFPFVITYWTLYRGWLADLNILLSNRWWLSQLIKLLFNLAPKCDLLLLGLCWFRRSSKDFLLYFIYFGA